MIGEEWDEKSGERAPIEIVDTRHSRDLEAPVPPEAEQAPAVPELEIVPEPEPEDLDAKHYPEGTMPPREEPEEGGEPSEEELRAAQEFELAQIRQVFGAGIVNYLVGHFNFLLNFAVIYLGRAPNPASGLVSPDLEKAKLAIDLLEFIYARIGKELPAQERGGVERVIADLKLGYMQALTESAPPPLKPAGN